MIITAWWARRQELAEAVQNAVDPLHFPKKVRSGGIKVGDYTGGDAAFVFRVMIEKVAFQLPGVYVAVFGRVRRRCGGVGGLDIVVENFPAGDVGRVFRNYVLLRRQIIPGQAGVALSLERRLLCTQVELLGVFDV